MALLGNIIVIVIFAAIGIVIIKFEKLKELVKFLVGGFFISTAMVAIGRIWVPDLSIWLIPVCEIILLVVAVVNRYYTQTVLPEQ